MIKTFDVSDLSSHEDELIFASKTYDGESFPNLFHCFRAWEYMTSLSEIEARYPDLNSEFTLVDVGSNDSWFPFLIADLYPHSTVWATDIGDLYDEYFPKKLPEFPLNLHYKKSFASQLITNFGKDGVDVVSCISVIEHIELEVEALSQMLGIVKADGVVLMTTDIDCKTPEKIVHRRYNFKMLKKMFNGIKKIAVYPSKMDVRDALGQAKKIKENVEKYNHLSAEIKNGYALWDTGYLSGFWTLERKK